MTRAVAEEAWKKLPDHVRQMYAEMVRGAPVTEPAPMSPEQRAIIEQQLEGSLDILGRMDVLVNWISRLRDQEKSLRTLLGMVSYWPRFYS